MFLICELIVRILHPDMCQHRNFSSSFLLFCNLGETLPLSSGNKITLKFTTNGTETAKGFHFVYQGKTAFFGMVIEF